MGERLRCSVCDESLRRSEGVRRIVNGIEGVFFCKAHDPSAKPNAFDLLGEALPYVPLELADQIKQVISPVLKAG